MIYVVTAGRYSDYHIEAVFTTRDAADEFAAKVSNQPGVEDVRVEPYEADSCTEYGWGPVYQVAINRHSGDEEWRIEGAYLRHPQRAVERQGYDGCIVIDSPVSYEHALKIAAEHRQAWLRQMDRDMHTAAQWKT